jgi:hypothetical protein
VQKNITSTSDIRLPEDVKAKITALLNPDELKNFSYTESKSFADSNLASVQQSIALNFSDGKIVGTITIIKSSVGYEPETKTYTVAICFSYCCIDEKGKKDCTTDYKEFLKNKQSDKCKTTTSFPCE